MIKRIDVFDLPSRNAVGGGCMRACEGGGAPQKVKGAPSTPWRLLAVRRVSNRMLPRIEGSKSAPTALAVVHWMGAYGVCEVWANVSAPYQEGGTYTRTSARS